MKGKLLTGAALLGVFALLLVFASPTYRQGGPGMAGRRAPDFTFELQGQPRSLGSLAGKVVVLNFWATWCAPCVEEMPSLNRLHEKIAGEGGMVLGVSVDQDAAAYQDFLVKHRITFPNLRDPSARIAGEYGTSMFPETYIVSVPPSGGRPTIQRKIIGPQDWDRAEWLDSLRAILAQQK